MRVDSPTGPIEIESREQLVELLSQAGHGECATFYFSHLAPLPWLSVHLNDSFAYVHFLAADQHPGFQAQGMTPEDCPDEVSFHHAPGEEGDPILMPRSCVLHRDAAVQAAAEFFASLERPASVDWFEL
jgi:hypothetical protein